MYCLIFPRTVSCRFLRNRSTDPAASSSDSLVSDYRRRIEQELRALSFSEVEEARRFETALRDRIKGLILAEEEKEVTA